MLKRKNFGSEIISSESANIFLVYVIPLLLFFVPHYQFENTARQVFEKKIKKICLTLQTFNKKPFTAKSF